MAKIFKEVVISEEAPEITQLWLRSKNGDNALYFYNNGWQRVSADLSNIIINQEATNSNQAYSAQYFDFKHPIKSITKSYYVMNLSHSDNDHIYLATAPTETRDNNEIPLKITNAGNVVTDDSFTITRILKNPLTIDPTYTLDFRTFVVAEKFIRVNFIIEVEIDGQLVSTYETGSIMLKPGLEAPLAVFGEMPANKLSHSTTWASGKTMIVRVTAKALSTTSVGGDLIKILCSKISGGSIKHTEVKISLR